MRGMQKLATIPISFLDHDSHPWIALGRKRKDAHIGKLRRQKRQKQAVRDEPTYSPTHAHSPMRVAVRSF